jgi:hypothetical protein
MLPGLVLTFGLVAQSIGALVTPAARNPDAPRFVNIGDDIIQSATAEPIAPAGVFVPAVPQPPIAVREVVVVQAPPPEDTADATPVTEEQHFDYGVEPITVFYPRFHRHPVMHHDRAPRHLARPQTVHTPLQPVMLPPFPTVLLPPQPTVLLPPQPTVLLPPGFSGPSTPLRAGG